MYLKIHNKNDYFKYLQEQNKWEFEDLLTKIE